MGREEFVSRASCPIPRALSSAPYNSAVNRAPRFCYAGTYERGYPRNWLTAMALRDSGVRVEEAHAPVWERLRDKSGVGPRQLARIALELTLAYCRLVPEVALRLLRCDALVIGYIGQLDMLLLGPVAKLMRKPVIFDPLVTLTDTIVEDRRLISPRSPLAQAIAGVDRVALRLADVVLVDTAENARFLVNRFSVRADRIVVLPVGADEVIFYPKSRANWDDANPMRPLDVFFYGKFIPLHGIETIIRAAAIVEERNLPVFFELVGTGQTYRKMRDLADQLGVDRILWIDWIPYLRLGNRLRVADVALGVFSGSAKAGRVVPNKVYQSLSTRVATITRYSPAIAEMLVNEESAILVPPDDPVALADAIEKLCCGEFRRRIAYAGSKAEYRSFVSRRAIMASVVERVMEGRWRRQPAID